MRELKKLSKREPKEKIDFKELGIVKINNRELVISLRGNFVIIAQRFELENRIMYLKNAISLTLPQLINLQLELTRTVEECQKILK